MTQSAIRSNYMIEKRIQKENQLKNLYNLIKQETKMFHKANWENNTAKIIENKQETRAKEKIQEQRKKFIDIRRKKLSDLMIAEEEAYKFEIIARQETPEQVRQKMEMRLKALKEERENERLNLVKTLQEKRFYQSADELRKNDCEAFAIECYLEQENQMLDKLRKRESEKIEEDVYVKLNHYDNLKKIEKERIQMEEKKMKEKKTYEFRDWQRKMQEEELKKASENKQIEIKRFKEQWDKDLKKEEEERAKAAELNKMVYRDIEDFNRKEEIERAKRIQFEKFKDKELINNILDKENFLDEHDKKDKEKRKIECQQNNKYLEYVMNKKKDEEAWLDKLAQIEADKQWHRTQEQWMKEEAAKIELLKQVYKEREEAVKNKKNLQEVEKNQLLKERMELDNQILKFTGECDRIQKEEFERRKKHQDDLKYQITVKERIRQKENQDKIYEERAAKLWEMEYQKRINDHKELHQKKLEDIKRREIS